MSSYHPHYSNGALQRRTASSGYRPSGISSNSRPRSLYGNTPSSSQSMLGSSYLNNSSLSNPSSFSMYGGTSSGYGGLTLPGSSSLSKYPSASSLSSHNPLSSSPTSYYNNILNSSNYGSRPGSPGYSPTSNYQSSYNSPSSSRSSSNIAPRSSSFNRHSHSPLLSSSNFGSRSSSISSLAASVKSNDSEGYISGNEGTSRLRLSTGSGDRSSVSSNPPTTENGELDYKKLYEQSQLENEMLREKLRKTEQDLLEIKSNNTSSKVTPSEIEKRERRAMERKLSEMEEELKQLQKLKMENERLRNENRALTRVVSKLTQSVNNATAK